MYEAAILPIVRKKCVACHGPEKSEGMLRLDSAAGIMAGGESGRVVVAGDPDASYLIELIEAGSMPPEDNQPLTDAERASIRQWVSSGAKSSTAVRVDDVRFHDVLPVLLLRCVACHGAQKQEAELDLRTHASILKGGESGPAVVPSDAAGSLLMKKIHAGEMPPKRRLVESSSKPIEPAEIARLAEWIRIGAPAPLPKTSVQVPQPMAKKDVAAGKHWAFQPLQKPAIPRAAKTAAAGLQDFIRNPVDAFIFAELQREGLSFTTPAEPLELMRRVYFDLTGLPPTLTQIRTFQREAGSDMDSAYENLVERLLASDQYGERWGRYWLDLAGYSDSEGVQHADTVRTNAWRYRDYVIRSLNSDKPYDRFLLEQIAGDELEPYQSSEGVSEQVLENLVATGFLRMAPDGTWANITNFVPNRLDVIGDEMEILTATTLGLTFKCARCHSHKFDPISHRNYHGLLAIFKGAFDEHDWLKPYGATQFSSGPFGRRQLSLETKPERERRIAANEVIDIKVAALRKKVDSHKAEEKDGASEAGSSQATEVKATEVKATEVKATEVKAAVAKLDEQIKQLEASRQAIPLVRAAWDRGEPSPTYLLRRGNYLTPGEIIEPHVPEFLPTSAPYVIVPAPVGKSTGRRLAFAKWLTAKDHPLTSRVAINRIWKNHFGAGLVRTPDNFGLAGEPPTHPELLDWLAVDFAENGWRMKRVHRLLMLSTTYRQSSRLPEQAGRLDPENRLLSRMPLRRLEAEALRDSLLFVSGQLDLRPFGTPDAVETRADGLVTSKRSADGWRRSIYVQQRRTEIPTLLENFDLPRMGPHCVQRSQSTVAPQALHLLNNKMVHQLAEHLAAATQQLDLHGAPDLEEADATLRQQISHIHWTALSRGPDGEEMKVALDTVKRLDELWSKRLADEKKIDSRLNALTNYCHAILNSASFIYVD
jgi:hypothetical protein